MSDHPQSERSKLVAQVGAENARLRRQLADAAELRKRHKDLIECLKRERDAATECSRLALVHNDELQRIARDRGFQLERMIASNQELIRTLSEAEQIMTRLQRENERLKEGV